MVNPLLTIIFDLFLVGSAITIVAAMVQEYLESRTPSIGGTRASGASRTETRARPVQTSQIRRRQLKRVA